LLTALWLAGAAPLAAAPGLPAPAAVEAKPPEAAPDKAPAKRAPAAQDYTPRPALWLLSDEDTKIYLFGTIHMLPPGFKWRSPALDQVAKDADELVVETVADSGLEDEAALLVSLMLDKPVPILERVPADKRPALRAATAKAGVAVEALGMMPTWLVAMMLGLMESLSSWGVDNPADAPGVEDVLEAQFREAGKPILSVETPEAALDALNAMPEADQVALLLETLAQAAESADAAEPAPDDRLWATGRPEEAYAIYMKDMPPLLYDGLLRKRNAAWVLWLEERLKTPGTVLFAVGTGHLAGPDSVQKMLAARGLEAKRVD
jgi:uncharacterized protein YbaP (TraB family)